MSDHFRKIYARREAEYNRMIVPEDVDSNLLPALLRIAPLAGKRILDLGGGTGRIPLLLKHLEPNIFSLDLYRAMLLEQATQRTRVNGNWPLLQADMRWVPFPSDWAEIVIAGWSIGHTVGWYPKDWRAQIGMILSEMNRVVQHGGFLIILETMGTGSLEPVPPSPGLAAYYSWLEDQWGFERVVVSTDYQFEDIEQAVELTEIFFGPELANRIRERSWARLPEWTGIWSKMNL